MCMGPEIHKDTFIFLMGRRRLWWLPHLFLGVNIIWESLPRSSTKLSESVNTGCSIKTENARHGPTLFHI